MQSDNKCEYCNGKCCRDDLGYKIAHMDSEFYMHNCDNCSDGYLPKKIWTAEEERSSIVKFLKENYLAKKPFDILGPIIYDIERGLHKERNK